MDRALKLFCWYSSHFIGKHLYHCSGLTYLHSSSWNTCLHISWSKRTFFLQNSFDLWNVHDESCAYHLHQSVPGCGTKNVCIDAHFYRIYTSTQHTFSLGNLETRIFCKKICKWYFLYCTHVQNWGEIWYLTQLNMFIWNRSFKMCFLSSL